MTYRYYLQDTAFAVASGEKDLLEEAAAQAPVWDIYLGRKTCAPTEFVYQGIFQELKSAFSRANEMAQEKQRKASFRVRQESMMEKFLPSMMSQFNLEPQTVSRPESYRDSNKH